MTRLKVFSSPYPDDLDKQMAKWIEAERPAIQGQSVAVDGERIAVVVSYVSAEDLRLAEKAIKATNFKPKYDPHRKMREFDAECRRREPNP